MKLKILALTLLLSGCANLQLIDVPTPGKYEPICAGRCTHADRNWAVAQNVIIWGGFILVGNSIVEMQSDE